jgi:hypothetical protein
MKQTRFIWSPRQSNNRSLMLEAGVMDEAAQWVEGKDLRRGLEAYRERLLASPASRTAPVRTTFLDTDTEEEGFGYLRPVTREQFVITAEGITHVPTGATFTPHPGNPHSGNMYKGQLGNKLRNGEDHRPHEVRK